MTISTVNASASASTTRAISARAGVPVQARSADDASTALQRSEATGRHRDRHAASASDAMAPRDSDRRAWSREGNGAGARDADTSADPKSSRSAAATSGDTKTRSRLDRTDESQDDEGVDTGVLVARFFDVLQAAAQAGAAENRAVSPATGDAADADPGDDGVAAPGVIPTATDGRSSDDLAPFDGAAMAMQSARSWGARDLVGVEAASDASSAGSSAMAAHASIGRAGGSIADAAAGNVLVATGATSAPSPDGIAGAAGSARGATVDIWPMFGPPASRPSARAFVDTSSRGVDSAKHAAAEPDAPASATASARAALDAATTVDATATAKALDRMRPAADTAIPRASSPLEGNAAQGGAVSALWPWPSGVADAPLSSTTVALRAGAPADWHEALAHALGDRLQLTLKQGGDQAVVRLDPPMLGRIDLSIRQDGTALAVHLSASNPEVLRQLQAMGDGLRQDLATRHAGDLVVTVSSLPSGQPAGQGTEADARQRQARPGDDAEQAVPGRALGEADAQTEAGLVGHSRSGRYASVASAASAASVAAVASPASVSSIPAFNRSSSAA